MFEYMTAQEAAEKWNVSSRWVQRLMIVISYKYMGTC